MAMKHKAPFCMGGGTETELAKFDLQRFAESIYNDTGYDSIVVSAAMIIEYTITPQLGHFTVIRGDWYGFNRGKRGTNPKNFGELNHPITYPEVEALVCNSSDGRIILDHSTDYRWGNRVDLYTGDNLEIHAVLNGQAEYITNGSFLGYNTDFCNYIKANVGTAVPINITHN